MRKTRSFEHFRWGWVGTLLLLGAGPARADWGEDWGTMIWSQVATPVPVLGPGGLGLLGIALLAAGFWVARGRFAKSSVPSLLAALAVAAPLTAYAATITLPNLFVNGSVADADEVNANFDTIVLESNDQDLRLSVLEAQTLHTHPGSDITSQVSDADTVDGVHAAALEESFEIDVDIAVHTAVSAAHHARYTNAEALVAAAGVDAGTLDGLDSSAFAAASHTHPYARFAIVAKSGGDYSDPLAAMNDLATWCGLPTSSAPCLLRILSGLFDLGNDDLVMVPYVDIEGSGRGATILRSNHSGGSPASSATVVGDDFAELRQIGVQHVGGTFYAYGIYVSGASPRITDVAVSVSGASIAHGISLQSSSDAVLHDVSSSAQGSSSSTGVSISASSPVLRNVNSTGFGGSTSYAFSVSSSATPHFIDVQGEASGATTNYGLFATTSSHPVLHNVQLEARNGTAAHALYTAISATATVRGGTLEASFATTARGITIATSLPLHLDGVEVEGIVVAGRTLFLRDRGDAKENGDLLLAVPDLLAGLLAPSAASPYKIQLDAARYDFENDNFDMQAHVHLVGAGRDLSVVTSTRFGGIASASATVNLVADSEVRSLSILHEGASSWGVAVYASGLGGAKVRDASLAATASGGSRVGFLCIACDASLENVSVAVSGTGTATGVSASTVSSLDVTSSQIDASGGTTVRSVDVDSSTVVIRRSQMEASGGTGDAIRAINSATVDVFFSEVRSGDTALRASSGAIDVGSSLVDGPVTGLTQCVGAFDASLNVLSGACS